jgi:hypothetical protein
MCEGVSVFGIYFVVFLVPLFFLPFTSDALDFNKQALLIVLAFISLFAWIARSLILGKLEFNRGKMNAMAGVYLAVFALATVFSAYKYASFWGWPQPSVDSLISVIAVFIVYFLVANSFTVKNILTSVYILCASAIIAEIFGILQILGIFVLPFDFAKFVSFNTVGSVGSLGFFTAMVLLISEVMVISAKKYRKILFALQIFLSAVILFVINYYAVWWVVALGSALLLIFGIFKKDYFDGRWMALPMFFLVVSVVFSFLNPQLPGFGHKTSEIYLSQNAGLKIALQTIKEKPFLGSGPGTFSFDFAKFKSPDFNKTSMGNVYFTQASSKILNDSSTTGAVGLVALIALMGFSVFYGVKFIFSNKSVIAVGFATALISEIFCFFLYGANIVLLFLFFFVMGSVACLASGSRKIYELKSASVKSMIAVFVFMIIFIFGAGIIILETQRYIAEVNYYKGINLLNAGKTDEAIKSFESAATMNHYSDLYFNRLSQAYLLKFQK